MQTKWHTAHGGGASQSCCTGVSGRGKACYPEGVGASRPPKSVARPLPLWAGQTGVRELNTVVSAGTQNR